ncbi:MAG: hypothetical protein P8Y07_05445 [Gemmatimonadales bacterium]
MSRKPTGLAACMAARKPDAFVNADISVCARPISEGKCASELAARGRALALADVSAVLFHTLKKALA